MVTLVIGGDEFTLNQILYSVKEKNPVVVICDSGTMPQLIAKLYYELEDAFTRCCDCLKIQSCDCY